MPRSLQLSATTLNLFQDCPRCFWLHMRASLKRPARPFPSITGGIDRLVQGYCEASRPRIPSLISLSLYAGFEKDGLAYFVELADPPLKTLACFQDHTYRLTGRLDDCLMFPGGVFAPLDHKSRGSRPAPGYSAQYYQLQMDVYGLLLRENGYAVGADAYLAYFYPTTRTSESRDGWALEQGFPFDCHVEALPIAPARALMCYQQACSCLDGPCPLAPSPMCAYCVWATEMTTYPLARRIPV